MRQTRSIMGMPVTVEIIGDNITEADVEPSFTYFNNVDQRFSTYKETSEISRINRSEIQPKNYSHEMKEIFRLAGQTKEETDGFFDIGEIGQCDPSGIVKGWAIDQAARRLAKRGYKNFYIDAGGDIATVGHSAYGERWRVGIRNPFNLEQIVKVVGISNCGIATSGNYERGEHIYNPHDNWQKAKAISSVTVIGPNIYDADRFATAAFVMGQKGINLIEFLPGLEGYIIGKDGQATMTSGFEKYILSSISVK